MAAAAAARQTNEINKVKENIQAMLSANAEVVVTITPAEIRIDPAATPEEAYAKIMFTMGIKDRQIIDRYKVEWTTMLRGRGGARCIRSTHMNTETSRLKAIIADFMFVRQEDGSLQVNTLSGLLKVDLSREWFYTEWKEQQSVEMFARCYHEQRATQNDK